MRAFLLGVALVATLAPEARAGSARVVIVSLGGCCPDEAWVEAEKITRAEFAALDFEVQVVPGVATGEKDRREELFKLARQNEAAAALRIVRSTSPAMGGVELWVMDQVTGKLVFRNIEVEWRANGDAASIVALRVVELLRASLLEIQVPSQKPAQIEKPLLDLVENVPRKARGFIGIGMGVATLGSPGGAGALGGVRMALSYDPIKHLGIELDGLVSFASRDIRQEGAASTFEVAAVRGWILWRILTRGVARPAIGLGGGVLVPWARGLDEARKMDRTVTGYVGGTAQLGLALSRNVWMRVLCNVGFSLPKTRIFFAKQKVATFGMPLVEGALVLEVRIP